MLKPRVIIVAKSERNCQVMRDQLYDLFGDIIEFDYLSLQKGMNSAICADLVLASTQQTSSEITKFLLPNTEILVIRRTIWRSSWEKLTAIPTGTKALLVNDDQEVTFETIALLYELAAKHLELIPYYPGLENIPEVKIAITPNEEKVVPNGVETIINIGDRVVDSSTIFDMLNKLELFDRKRKQILISHITNTVPRSPGLVEVFNYITENKLHLELILDVVNEGVIAFTGDDKIIIYNKYAKNILKVSDGRIIGISLRELFPNETVKKIHQSSDLKDEVVQVYDSLFVVNKYPLVQSKKYLGGVITLKECTEIQRLELKFRQKMKSKGLVAKYTFADIKGRSTKLLNTIAIAKKFALGNSSVLIQGDSGTGKELFVQSIHNASDRKEKPFVAFSCAALTDSLIESELFGYSEGAFTGAKKGGKPGLFELAHGGTLFLDEIGDISPNVQARLLRVIQEKEVIRVGGTEIIPVDIRIIAATNKDLLKLVKKGKFRKDLLYRLNILRLSISPLSERKEDIPYLIDSFLNKRKIRKDIPNKIMELFQYYDWPGNVRELEGCLEYMINVSDNIFTMSDLPSHIFEEIKRCTKNLGEVSEDIATIGNPEELVPILMVLKNTMDNRGKIGRRMICKKLREHGLNITEQEVRSRLQKLKDYGYVVVGQGRAGTRLSSKGYDLVKERVNGLNGLNG